MKFAPEFRSPVVAGEKNLMTLLNVPGLNYKREQTLSLDFLDGMPEVEIIVTRVSRPWIALKAYRHFPFGLSFDTFMGKEGFETGFDFQRFIRRVHPGVKDEAKFITYEFELKEIK